MLREGSSMLVFYDPGNLDALIPQCATRYEVVVPGFGPDYVDEAR